MVQSTHMHTATPRAPDVYPKKNKKQSATKTPKSVKFNDLLLRLRAGEPREIYKILEQQHLHEKLAATLEKATRRGDLCSSPPAKKYTCMRRTTRRYEHLNTQSTVGGTCSSLNIRSDVFACSPESATAFTQHIICTNHRQVPSATVVEISRFAALRIKWLLTPYIMARYLHLEQDRPQDNTELFVATKFSRSAAGSGALHPESHAIGVTAVTPKG